MTIQRAKSESDEFFEASFLTLTGYACMPWQMRLFRKHFLSGDLPEAVGMPTGLGKTAVMAVWLIGLAWQMRTHATRTLPRRLVYVVDRRAVVDQSTTFAEKLRAALSKPEAEELRAALRFTDDRKLAISTLRGQFVDNREWLEDPSQPAIVVGTVDMIGSRLLFEGYGVSRKMRSYHAGLLGTDALVLLDEAHLVPPFESLLAEIAGNSEQYGPKLNELSSLIPRFQLLPLSATGRRQTAKSFTLEEADFRNPDDPVVIERLFAKKRLELKGTDGEALEIALLNSAWALSENGTKPVRIIIYCNSRDVAEKVKGALDKMVNKTPAQGQIELFVGARRVRERIEAEDKLRQLGFIAGEKEARERPAFLVATSAGEVGVDLDADHMVGDLVAWERMVQRFGRVNRRGGKGRQAEIVVIVEPEPKTKPKKAVQEALDKEDTQRTDKDRKAIIEHERLLEELLAKLRSRRAPFGGALQVQQDGSFDVSPESLRQLNERARTDEGLSKIIEEASSKPPLRPVLNRALVDAWSMTSLPEHTGRPEVEPWLRGWISDKPQTSIVWRRYLPIRPELPVSKKEIEDFFEAAPFHVSETLDTESYRVRNWLQTRAGKLDAEWKPEDVVGMLFSVDGRLVQTLRLLDIPEEKDPSKGSKKHLEELERNLYGKMLVMDARFGGLRNGLLNDDFSDVPVADDGELWIATNGTAPIIRFRICKRDSHDGELSEDWSESLRFDLERSTDGEAKRWFSIQKWRDTSNTENDRATGRPQSLVEHQSWAAKCARTIGERLHLPDEYIRVLVIAARLHDEGKRAANWQRAFRAHRDAVRFGIPGPLAKTRGPINQALLNGYRHEFGSLPYAMGDTEFGELPEDLQNLVLHLISAHHGFARPLIETKGCDDAPPSVLSERAREVALRFSHLQRRWGPWGLAWWEALLRAADAQASRANDEATRKPSGRTTDG